jgi:hypothetical protein
MTDAWREIISKSKWLSTYEINNYGDLLYEIIKLFKPEKIVELGVKAGYSTYFMAKAVKENGFGEIDSYDLWEKYPFSSCPKAQAEENLKEVLDVVNLFQEDAIGVDKKYESADVLHIDLINCGELLEQTIIPWLDKAALIIIEGGSEERDHVDWIKKYNKMPIRKWLTAHEKELDCFTFNPFPSLTIIKKKSGKAESF